MPFIYMSTGAQKINHLGFMASVTLHKLWITSTGNFKICACGEEIRVCFDEKIHIQKVYVEKSKRCYDHFLCLNCVLRWNECNFFSAD